MKQPDQRETHSSALTLPKEDPTLALLAPKRHHTKVSLPPELSKEAVIALFHTYWMEEVCIWTEEDRPPSLSIAPDDWCIAFPETRHWVRDVEAFLYIAIEKQAIEFAQDGRRWIGLLLPRHTLPMKPRQARHIHEAVEKARMQMVPDGQVPASWVPPQIPTDALYSRAAQEHDALLIDLPEELPQLPALDEDNALPSILTDAEIEQVFQTIRAHLQLPPFPFVLRRGKVNKHGFVTGQVCFTRDKTPRRMAITTCPNADMAEVTATLIHEFAHTQTPLQDHNRHFKQALIELAQALYGAAYFDEALARIDAPYRVVDLWVAVGIRAALLHQAPPVAKVPQERATTKVVGQIQMLRSLGADQVGRPEGINATAIANTKIALHGLEAYQIKLDLSIDDQMVDLWIDIGKRVLWHRRLMYAVTSYCQVFALELTSRGWMHLFGKHQHIVTAEYLYDICKEQIERKWLTHKEAWKQQAKAQGLHLTGGAVRSEKTSFCQQAVKGLNEQMKEYRQERNTDGDVAYRPRFETDQRQSDEQHQARLFAEHEHHRRGLGWVGGAGPAERENLSGYEAGLSIKFNEGIGAGAPIRGLLPKGKP